MTNRGATKKTRTPRLLVADSDAVLIRRIRRGAMTAWLIVVAAGLLMWGADALDLHTIRAALNVLVWVAAAAFAICCAALGVSAVVLLATGLSGRDNGT